MLNKLYHYFFQRDINFYIDKHKSEFDDIRVSTNIQRCEKLLKIFLGIIIFLMIIDLTVFKPLRTLTNAYLYLFYSRVVMLVLNIISLLLLKIYKYRKDLISGRVLYHIMANIVIYWGVFLALNDLDISGQISAYIICIFCVSISLYLTPLEGILTFFTSLAVFIIGLILKIDDIKVLYSHILNASISVFVSCIVSNMNLMSFSKEFTSRKYILERKAQLEITNKKLNEYEKLRTDFFANISHELRTPVNVIYCAQQMMELDLKNNPNSNINKYLKMVKQNSYRLIRLIGNLIDITKIDAVSFEVKLVNEDIVRVVEDVTLSVVSFVESRGLTITFDTTVEEKLIACDPDKIERIILNLLSNAVKFTEKGGSIFVNIYTEEDKVYISVKDTGIGIPKEMQELIFDRFIQVDKSTSKKREGSGIGLSLTKSLVELQGGTIMVNSKPNEGSEFIIALPDVLVQEEETNKVSLSLEEDYVKRISIEFSDIYDY